MSYEPPEGNQVGLELGPAYTPPEGNQVGLELAPGASPPFTCNYIPPIGNQVDFDLDGESYIPPQTPNVNFSIDCGGTEPTLDVDVNGSVGLGVIEVEGSLEAPQTITGSVEIGVIEVEGNLEVLQPFVVTGNAELDPIAVEGFIGVTLSISGEAELDPITVEGSLDVSPVINGYNVQTGEITGSSEIERGNRILFSNMRAGNIITVGAVNISTDVLPSEVSLGEIQVTSLVLEAAVVLPSDVQIGDIVSNRNRVWVGYERAPKIREAYEISNNRFMDIPSYPEEANYPVLIGTTDFDLDGKEIKSGTLEFKLEYDHDRRDIDEITVWVLNSNGIAFKDKARIIGKRELGVMTDHVLYDPFRNHLSARIPVHCINDKDAEFYLEIKYAPDRIDTLNFRKEEKHIIPFQAHFDNRVPYLNIADSIPEINGNAGNQSFKQEYVSNTRIFESFEDISNCHAQAGVHNKRVEFDFLTRIFLDQQQSLGITSANAGNTKFEFEYVDLHAGQIGG
jgi:hypothetical protein